MLGVLGFWGATGWGILIDACFLSLQKISFKLVLDYNYFSLPSFAFTGAPSGCFIRLVELVAGVFWESVGPGVPWGGSN